MPVHNSEIAGTLDLVADLLEVEGANPFRVRAYRNAARIVNGLSRGVTVLLEKGEKLADLPGIGEDLAGKIQEIAQTGKLRLLEEIERRTSPSLVELLKLPGLGPKRVRVLRDKLGVNTAKDLAHALAQGRLAGVAGFGAKLQQMLRDALREHGHAASRFKLSVAQDIADSLVVHLKRASGVGEIVVAGSFRRRKETVGDLDILATARESSEVMDRLVAYDEVQQVLARGATRSTVILRSGLHVDLRVVSPASYGAALHYFTGCKAHNIAVRALALKRGLKINEYGIFRGRKRLGGGTEAEVYAAVGLPLIEPELREDTGEIDAARKGELPALIEAVDIRGDLHVHTSDSDGTASIEEMAEAAQARGYEYLAITDHSQHVTVAHGLNARRLAAQIKRIDKLNDRLRGITVLKGCEVDILEDGSLDLPDDVLRDLDLTICSIHSKLNLPRERQTERILRAMDHPSFRIWGHPTGRLIDAREPSDLDMDALLRAARERGRFVEVNAQPERLDLNDLHCRLARDLGVMVSIGTDAHRISELDFMRYGVGQARRGWLAAANVLNTRSLAELRTLLGSKNVIPRPRTAESTVEAEPHRRVHRRPKRAALIYSG
jgi:DNA polymerase (family 10)